MFSPRSLDDDIAAVRDRYAPDSPVLDVDSDFETLPPAAAEDLGLFVDALDPASSPAEWLPEAVPDLLRKHAGPAFTVGLPGDGTVVRTTQTDPPAVLVKRRAEGTPDEFLAFLVAERLVQIGCEPAPGAVGGADTADSPAIPESFLPFFGERYRDLDAAIRRPDPETGASTTGFGPTDVFQVANALFDAWVGLHTRDAFASWEGEYPRLFDAWADAGERLSGRLGGLSGEVARGDTEFPAATEYACSAVKHDLDLPAPYGALDTTAYRERGSAYAVAWAEKTFAALVDEE
ncbi:hypothetical protein C463_13709 [Halorubrum californiense DSM 19288]|uniref:Uncharacterized protein n=1 Tax=Halorubrum californiense DSM 19288 TaxID=1227465 RepID=M0E0G9_9EURY|nr:MULTISPECIES: hypothetical protein [Halorubrum]ELZ41305.1 hypothetical protein C463_13709 [Halorubrum californiense DSM 19288]TKX71906.1 hypothetical protein EXE40_06135 [Halorubrum sp. GN11GM_10-3_MGM]